MTARERAGHFETSREADAAFDALTDGDRPGEVDDFIADQFLVALG